MNEYLIRYRVASKRLDGRRITHREALEFRCTAKSKVEALMLLVNLDAVHEVISVKRIKK